MVFHLLQGEAKLLGQVAFAHHGILRFNRRELETALRTRHQEDVLNVTDHVKKLRLVGSDFLCADYYHDILISL